MSGIMAIVSLDGRPVPPELPRAQLAAIAHRGEWEPRLWEAPGVALGHVNLPRTPEAEREFLPMSDRTERYWLTWDGRLDNRDELGPKLGYDVNERAEKTDAAYVLDAFIKWGDDCVHHLLGDWALVIWDNEARRLFCAKDPIGWRQLYYAEHEGLLAVGSEPQQFFANGWLPRVVNADYVLRFLAGAMHARGSTPHQRVSELRGGARLGIASEVCSEEGFWQPAASQLSGKAVFEEYLGEFERLFHTALNSRLRSNRPVAVLLSGGLDSSLVTKVGAGLEPSLQAFTLFVPNTKWLDERDYARLVAERAGLQLHEVDVTDCWFLSERWLPEGLIDQPFIPGAGTALRKVTSNMAQRDIGVVLGGEGGDEWIDGGNWAGSLYRPLASALVSRRFRVATRIAETQMSQRAALSSFVRAALDGFTPESVRALLGRPRVRSTERFWPFVETQKDWIDPGSATLTLAWERRKFTDAMIEVYRDAASAEISWRDRHVFSSQHLESRSPFNDLRVVELLLGAPDWVKQACGRPRSLLRGALRRAGLPEIADRTDKGVYEEQLQVGLLCHERARFEVGVATVQSLPGIRASQLQSEVEHWRATKHRWSRPLYHAATAGLWLAQTNSEVSAPKQVLAAV